MLPHILGTHTPMQKAALHCQLNATLSTHFPAMHNAFLHLHNLLDATSHCVAAMDATTAPLGVAAFQVTVLSTTSLCCQTTAFTSYH